MIYDPEDDGGVFLFLFRTLDDEPCEADYWYQDVAEAERHGKGSRRRTARIARSDQGLRHPARTCRRAHRSRRGN